MGLSAVTDLHSIDRTLSTALTALRALQVTEVGDGNINFVYIVKGPAGAVCLKQGLPFVRIAGDSWPLTQVGLCCLSQGMWLLCNG